MFTIDIETTNRCNARCRFCPRDRTPHQGLMTDAVFGQALQRAIEFREHVTNRTDDVNIEVSLCGLGEPLLHPDVPAFVARIRDAGFPCVLSTNASRLDERTGRALLDAGLNRVYINAGELGDDYEDVYALPFEPTRANIARFVGMAAGRCVVQLVLVEHAGNADRVREVEHYWRAHGVGRVGHHDLINRSGSLSVESMDFATHPLHVHARAALEAHGPVPVCGVPFRYLFVGYDGRYYLCSSDWEKQVPVGSIFDESFVAVTWEKLRHVESREPICKACCHDPANRLTQRLEALASGGANGSAHDVLVEREVAAGIEVRALVGSLGRPAVHTSVE